ncbi:MAG TPA: lipoyl domain-containing protein [Candidatus Hydrogenedentes bacterium]|jgi:pyruvate dehydrogenase E2 component (dihydrolipoamide acetyltransferase)|nr:MAG: Dihydrolipoyllysine-residue acetyltransferase component of pyruvate dehydrogenase complex [Candidatus Hydrogenedentes bacterium ADurb.Bin170]HNZ48260.1 lipoyl domain-containing protein [Candidatus Hydrogenedentota bacterium]HOD95052.1 lipoyl domain-containing protein [Candidatus Hydrogenedentota bacterium]HOM48744.1 lipoyl domain-containing protein [Candidatus Hydrogenedentota bacterium]HOR50448.1 lipoyl domain-containing protein [Candidatus Hydrogenedentota bacterium]
MAKQINVVLPDLGEGTDKVLEATVSGWAAETGAAVKEGDDLLEIVTDKASFVVPSPVSGILSEQCVQEDDAVKVGDLIAVITVE